MDETPGLLVRCNSIWGKDTTFSGAPTCETCDDATYLPVHPSGHWGIFYQSGSIVDRSVDYIGPELGTKGQSIADISLSPPIDCLEIENLFYGGRFNPHFGHFLIDFLPRLWPLVGLRTRDVRILCHGTEDASHWFSYPFVRETLGALGLEPSNFIVPDRPLRVKHLMVPGTSLRERAFGYSVYEDLCRCVRERLQGVGASGRGGAVYLSKSRLPIGVGRFVNEIEIEERLSAKGVEIAYPETMSLIEQIRLFSNHKVVFGSIGSALHVNMFAPPGGHIIALTHSEGMSATFSILDKLHNTTAEYWYAKGTLEKSKNSEGFLTNTLIPSASFVADQLLAPIN